MPRQKRCLLSLDGGGVRSISQLIILKELMIMINPSSPPEPYECFDLIGGSSTGGLLAVMLGRLRMSVDDCIRAYLELGESIFAKPRSVLNLIAPLRIRARYDHQKLQKVGIQAMMMKSGLSREELLNDEDTKCRVFVCAVSMATTEIRRFRSYVSTLDSLGYERDIKIWDAVLATMASPSYFDPIAIGPSASKFIDGAIGANNPIRFLLQEAKCIWSKESFDEEDFCIISIGSGIVSKKGFGESLLDISQSFIRIATDSEREAEYFSREHPSLAPFYFRFNVDLGLDDIRLDDWRQMRLVQVVTGHYAKNESIRGKLLACGQIVGASRTWPWSDIKDLDENFLSKSAGDAFTVAPTFSDSGYSSGSSFFKSDLEHNKAEEDLFNILTKDSELEPLYQVAICEIGLARFQKNFILLLKRYCGWLNIVAQTEMEKASVKFVRVQVRPMAVRISSHFKINRESRQLAPLLVNPQSQGSHVDMIGRYLKHDPVDSAGEERQSSVPEYEENEEGPEAEDDEELFDSPVEGGFGYLRDFLVSGEPFNNLRKDFWKFVVQKAEVSRSSFLASNLPSKVYVQNALEPWFPSNFHQQHKLKISIYWNVLEYLQKELEDGQSLKSLLTLSGDEENAFAATCSDYLDWLYPKSSQVLLEALLDALELTRTKSTEILRKGDRFISLVIYGALPAQKLRERAELVVNGTPEDIISVVHQIAWLGLVFRSPVPGELSYSDFTLQQSSLLQFDLKYSPAQVVDRSSDKCWHPLFTGLVLANGFPIPMREKEVGVELPFDVMTSLGGVMHPVVSEGGYVLRGFSSIIYPISQPSRQPRRDSVQWHALHAINSKTSVSLESLKNLPRLKLSDLAEFETLASYRTFLGYSSEVRVRLGTQDSDYGQSLRPHGQSLGPQKSRLMFSGLSANINGSHYVGAGVGANWSLSKTKAAEIREASRVSYEAILSEVMDQPSVLYDVKDCRGWLVPTICVILQMVHVRALYWAKQQVIPALENPIPFSMNGNDTASTLALQAIIKDFKDPKLYVSPRGQEAVHLSAWVTELWAAIDAMRLDIVNEKPLKRAGLVGWDFFNVANKGTACAERKETRRKFQGCWKDLINQSGIVVFHGIGFGEIIKARTPICSVWNPIPIGEDLLIACIESVTQLQDLLGSSFASISDFKICFNEPPEWPKEDSFSCDARTGKRCFRHVHMLRGHGELHPIEGSKYSRGAVVFGDNKAERVHSCEGLIEPSEIPPNQVNNAFPPAEEPMTEIAGGPMIPNGNPPEQAQQDREDINIYLVEVMPREEFRTSKYHPIRPEKLMYVMVGTFGMFLAFTIEYVLRRVVSVEVGRR